jgi:hypothetical protein
MNVEIIYKFLFGQILSNYLNFDSSSAVYLQDMAYTMHFKINSKYTVF